MVHRVTKEVVLNLGGPSPRFKDRHGNQPIRGPATTKLNRKDFALEGVLSIVGDEISTTTTIIDVEFVRRASDD